MSFKTGPGALAPGYATIKTSLTTPDKRKYSEAEVDALLAEFELRQAAGDIYTKLRTFTPGTRFRVI